MSKTSDEVMAEVVRVAPQLACHMQMDRSWIWYCGPTLVGAHNKEVREALKGIGFRFAPKGRVVNGVVGNWAHSCTAPTPRYKKARGPALVGEVVRNDNDGDNAMALLEML